MRRRTWGVLIAICGVLLVFAFLRRGDIRDVWAALRAPRLPEPVPFVKTIAEQDRATEETTSPFEGGVATSEHYQIESAPKTKTIPKDRLAFKGILPDEVNLDVPFTPQAPTGNWDMPYQEACEEASIMMVDEFYHGKNGTIPAAEADAGLQHIVAFEKQTLGFYEDTTAEETARVIRLGFNYEVIVKPFDRIEDLKRVLALGYPVVLPTAGKLLGNPNYRNGGPRYHMLVLRGYTPSRIITNDAGTRKGLGYTYTYDTILNAAHDWNGGDVEHGKRVMMVMLPKL